MKKIKLFFRNNKTLMRIKCQLNVWKFNCSKGGTINYIQKKFKSKLGYELNLDNPTTFNEKLQWLKLNWYDSSAIICADKYLVRSYLHEKGLDSILNDLICVVDDANCIDWTAIPDQFVIKSTHGSGMLFICKDKMKLNLDIESIIFNSWLKVNYHKFSGEWVYNTLPRLIIEKYLENDKDNLYDYKIFCFNGQPEFIQLDFDRFSNHKRNIYDLNWNLLDVSIKYPASKEAIFKKPDELDEMLKYAAILSKDFPHVRVDFYLVNHNIIFGEMTFFHGGGFEFFSSKKWELLFGDKLQLPKKIY